MGWVGAVISLAGTAYTASSQEDEGREERKAANRAAEMHDYEADYIKKAAKIEENRLREFAHKTIGAQRAATAAQGFAIGEGTSVDLENDVLNALERDIAVLRWRSSIEARQERRQAGSLRITGRNLSKAGRTRATATLLSGVGNTYSNWVSTSSKTKS